MKNKWILIALVGFLAYTGFQRSRSGPPLSRALESTDDPCYQKNKCVVVYTAPWCSACDSSMETIKEMDRRWNVAGINSKNGIKVFVGQDEPEKCKEKVNAWGTFARLDEHDQFYKKHRISVFPTWLVFDSKGKEIKRVKGGFPNPDQVDQIGTQILGL